MVHVVLTSVVIEVEHARLYNSWIVENTNTLYVEIRVALS